MPVQVNGKVRGRLTVPADDVGAGARARSRSPIRRVQAHTAGKTVQEGRRGERTAGVDRRAMRCSGLPHVADRSRWRSRARAAATRWPGAARSCPTTSGSSAFRSSRTAARSSRSSRCSPRRSAPSSSAAASTRVVPEAAGADAVLTGEVTGDLRAAGRLQRAAAGLALSLHADDEGAVHRRADQRGALVERRADVPRGVRAADAEQHRPRRRGVPDQERSSFDRIANDVARTVVTAIVEAF